MKKVKGKQLGAVLFAVVISCAMVQPAFAEEIVYGGTEQAEGENVDEISAESSEGGQTGKIPASQAAADDIPKVTVSEVTWKGGLLEVPVELNNDDVEPWLVSVTSDGDTQSFWCKAYDKDKAVFSVVEGYRVCNARQILGKAGEYDAEVKFLSKSDPNGISYPAGKFKLKVGEDSQMWDVTPKAAKFDGSQDITFSFKNGTNYYELESIGSIQLFVYKGNAEVNPVMTDGFTVDMDSGTLTIDGKALKAAFLEKKDLIESERRKIPSLSPLPTMAYVNVYANSVGSKDFFQFSVVHKEGSAYMLEPAWELDLTEFDWSTGIAGDATQDGKVDVFDLMQCLNHVSGKKLLTGNGFAAADIDGNGEVDLFDLMKILNHIAKGGVL